MAKRHFNREEQLELLTPWDMGLRYLSLRRLEFYNKTMQIQSSDEEICLVCIDGEVSFRFENQRGTMEMNDLIYLPRDSKLALSAYHGTLIRFGAPCSRRTEFKFIPFMEIDQDFQRHVTFGSESLGTKRDLWSILNNSVDSCRFLVGICKGCDGNWTVWPPHAHDKVLEACFVYFDMKDSYGIQLVYEDSDDPETVALVKEGHAVAIPKGFHPNCGSPQGGISFICCYVALQEDQRVFDDVTMDPAFGSWPTEANTGH